MKDTPTKAEADLEESFNKDLLVKHIHLLDTQVIHLEQVQVEQESTMKIVNLSINLIIEKDNPLMIFIRRMMNKQNLRDSANGDVYYHTMNKSTCSWTTMNHGSTMISGTKLSKIPDNFSTK